MGSSICLLLAIFGEQAHVKHLKSMQKRKIVRMRSFFQVSPPSKNEPMTKTTKTNAMYGKLCFVQDKQKQVTVL